MASDVRAPMGTRKGPFLLRGDDDRRSRRVNGPLLDGREPKLGITSAGAFRPGDGEQTLVVGSRG
jgi:hypothetical protein